MQIFCSYAHELVNKVILQRWWLARCDGMLPLKFKGIGTTVAVQQAMVNWRTRQKAKIALCYYLLYDKRCQ